MSLVPASAVTVLDQAPRNSSGPPSSSLDVPADATGYEVYGILSDADVADPTKALRLIPEEDYDDGTGWAANPDRLENWVGGSVNKGNFVPPVVQVQFDPTLPKPHAVRGTVDTRGQTLNYGIAVNFLFA